MTSPTLEKSESSRVGTHTRHGRFSHMDRDAYITINELSNGKRVLYDKRDVDGTFVEYTPPKDKMKRLYLGP